MLLKLDSLFILWVD